MRTTIPRVMVAALALLTLAACPAPSVNSSSPTPTSPGSTSPFGQASEDLRNLPACDSHRIRLASAGFPDTVTGGGVAVSIELVTDADCWLTHPPAIMVVDAAGRVVTVGVVELVRTKILRKREPNIVIGEWRDVCTAVTPPLRVRMLVENRLISTEAEGRAVPTCFVNGVPAKAAAPPPSGFLNVILDSG